MNRSKNVGLVLGSGSSRGWAHIGVIQALEESKIPIHCMAGVSIGAFVAAIHSTGNLKSLQEFVLQLNKKMILSYFDLVFPRTGLLDGKKVHDLFSMHTKAQTFDDFGIPVKIVATELYAGQEVVMDSGNIIEAVRASLAIPGILTPVRQGDKLLVDGGLVNPVPVDVARSMGADVVIAVNLNTGLTTRHRKKPKEMKWLEESLFTLQKNSTEGRRRNELIAKLTDHLANTEASVRRKIKEWLNSDRSTPNIIDIIGLSISIAEERIAKMNLEVDPPDVLIEPRLGDLKFLDFDQAERSIREGYARTREKIDDIRAALRR
ncbi:MAG: patatin-like phospholipase family protein [Fidelibacterota bacterium]